MKLNKNINSNQAAVKSPALVKSKNSAVTALLVAAIFCTMLTGCQKGDLLDNPNAASSSTVVPASLILNRITNEFYLGGGVLDGEPGAYNEGPWNQVMRWNQYFVSNYPYYWGSNTYNWTVSATEYDMVKYVSLLQAQVQKQYGSTPNPYSALSKFFQAYSFIWLTQRVGDIPMSQAVNSAYTQPKYDLQHDVYKNCLALLDTANTLMGAITTSGTATKVVDATGDIFGLTYLQWQKVINTYKLRVLISLSKRASDNADLNIPQQFAAIIANPTQYPIMTANADNLAQHYLSSPSANNYPLFPNYTPYIGYESMCNTFLNITTSTQDPRTFIAASPAVSQINAGVPYSSFAAYVGADIGQSYTSLTTNVNNYSANNYLRYYGTAAGPNVSGSTCEPYIIIGYPEMCFNIAEAANLGWIPGGGSSWYTAGIKASMSWLGLSDGATVQVGLPTPANFSAVLGNVTVSVSNFLNNSAVVYAGDNAAGRTQILTQKYVAFWQNSGWEAYYNWRRTGVPAFSQGGPNIGTPSLKIPLRWQYPVSEQTRNATNYKSAISSQYGGSDDITQPMWLIK
jgi:hypothetical protein